MRIRKFIAVVAVAFLFAGALVLQYAHAQAKGGTVKVQIHYKGSGKVEDSHKVHVFLFDSPDFAKGAAMAFAVQSTNSKDGIVTFMFVTKSPVYIGTVYAPTSAYDSTLGPPPKGSSLGMYATTPGTPTPLKVEDGKTASAEVTFDDSVKMQ
jgi:hypothetical protein